MQEIVTLYQQLLRVLFVPDERPRVLPQLARIRRRRQLRPPPIVCLVADDIDDATVLEKTRDWLEPPRDQQLPRWKRYRAAPRAMVDLIRPDERRRAAGDDALSGCLWILDCLRSGLEADDTGMGPIVFPRYRTASWLVRVGSGRDAKTGADAGEQLQEQLPKLVRASRRPVRAGQETGPQVGQAVPESVPWYLRLLFALWPMVRGMFGNRLLEMSRQARWFMGQRYLTPRLSDSFLGFADRLAAHKTREDPEQVAKLLVHSFLEDLRKAYGPRIFRPATWRHTAYPVILLHGVAPDNFGGALLRRVSDVRNETGLFDPLVTITTMNRASHTAMWIAAQAAMRNASKRPETNTPDPGEIGEINIGQARSEEPGFWRDPWAAWKSTVRIKRHQRDPGAWYLPLDLPGQLARPGNKLLEPPSPKPPKPPFSTRRWVVASAATALVVVLASLSAVYVEPRLTGGCATWPWDSGVGVAVRDGECVGYSDNSGHTFADDEALIELQQFVFEQNRTAEQALRNNPRRTLVSLIYFAGLTYTVPNVRYPRAQVEELAGLAMQQRAANESQDESVPLLRIIAVNGGTVMRHAVWVTEHLLRPLIRDDPSIVGVVGLDRSSTETRRAIALLGESGVPVMTTTLSADGLGLTSPLYFQPIPSNSTQARLVADYVQGARDPSSGQARYDKVAIYYPDDDPNDLYVRTLADSMRKELSGRDIPFREETWKQQSQLNGLPKPCAATRPDRQELHFFAGRNYDFGAFIRVLIDGCSNENVPAILGDDAVTRYITDPEAQRSAPAGVPIRYVAKGVPVLLGGRTCVGGVGRVGNQVVSPGFNTMCVQLAALVERLQKYKPERPGDRTGLAYDIAAVFLQAVGQNRARTDATAGGVVPNRGAIASEIRDHDYVGVTGPLHFKAGRITDDATIGILRTDDIRSAEVTQHCLLLFDTSAGPDSGRGSDGCPVGTRPGDEDWAR
ncbi:hypothetical protein [Nocardia wallacei]|uniref:hypothetical protein n=1 Tax=Nocardia wallacei TaxID=480035 RepID=UPI0024549D9C|nr:hypothetical protein [Nocardia wallacei]